jgi:hypothetical protein
MAGELSHVHHKLSTAGDLHILFNTNTPQQPLQTTAKELPLIPEYMSCCFNFSIYNSVLQLNILLPSVEIIQQILGGEELSM